MRIWVFFALGFLGSGFGHAQTPSPPAKPDPRGVDLRMACWNGDLDKVTSLLNEGAPLEGCDNQGRTGLVLACHGGSNVVRYLLTLGARVNAAEYDGGTPLSFACEFGELDSAQVLIDAGANLSPVNKYGRTPLMLAARGGHDDLVSLLISHHVDVNFHDPNAPAVFLAIANDHPSTAKLLLDAGADPQFGWSKTTDPNEVVSGLMGWLGWPKSADPNEARFRLMIWAAATNDPDVVDLLLDHGLDVNSCDQKGMTVLIKTVQAANRPIVTHLLDKGADPNLQQDDGQTALMLSVNYQQPPELQSLLDHGAKLEARDKQGRTALIWACYFVYDPNIQFLVEHGADINAADTNGETPLTYAGDRGDVEMVKYLADKGAARTDVHILAKPLPQPPLPVDHSWALAVGAIYPQTNGNNPHVLGYDNPESVDEMRAGLKDQWGIHKPGFLKVIDDLAKTGHRVSYQQDGMLLAGLSNVQFDEKYSLLSNEQQVEARAKRASYQKWQEKTGLAWDLCRAANLINFGVVAHFIDEKEAWPLLMDNARLTQASFNSWQEMSDNYLDGREIWATGKEPSFEACSQMLCNPKDPNSPWNQLPWKTDLSAN